MDFMEPERDSTPGLSGSQSPTATQLATFTPFSLRNSQSSDGDPSPARFQDPFNTENHHSVTGLQQMQSAQTFPGTDVMGPPRFLGQFPHNAMVHADAARYPAGTGPQGQWSGPASSRSFAGPPNPELPRSARGRRFVVRNVPTDIENLQILKLFHEFSGLNGPQMNELNTKGHFHVSFLDIRDAKRFVDWISVIQPGWDLCPVPADEFARRMRYTVHLPIQFDDMNLVTVYCGNHSGVQGSEIVSLVKPILDLVGSVHSITEFNLGTSSSGLATVHEMIVCWYNTSHATNAIKVLNGIRTDDFVLEVMLWFHGMEDLPIRHWTAAGAKKGRDSPRHNERSACTTPGRNLDLTPMRYTERRSSAEYFIATHRIISGRDKRTTIMLRNIPSSMSSAELESILNTTSAKQFDFLYLRIDFEHKRNVGYAFVNFPDPNSIIPFINARQGRPWPGYPASRNDYKVAEMSYATWQGKDVLVEKFRNSPVILNARAYRPKVYNITGPRSGQETAFPPVNNFYILSKAVELAQKTGIFRSGNHSGSHTKGRCWQYSGIEDDEVAHEELARQYGSPTRHPHGYNTLPAPRAPRTSLQEWNATIYKSRGH